MTLISVRILFVSAALFDFIVGLVFLCFGPQLYDYVGIPHPNHWGYVQFASLMLMVFGTMFIFVARDPVANHNLIPFGMLLKLSYVVLVTYYWVTTDCPMLFKPFVIVDGVFFLLFVLAYTRRKQVS